MITADNNPKREENDMDTYVTGSTIRRLREEKGLTQAQLAEMIDVSAKAVSKWETGVSLR